MKGAIDGKEINVRETKDGVRIRFGVRILGFKISKSIPVKIGK